MSATKIQMLAGPMREQTGNCAAGSSAVGASDASPAMRKLRKAAQEFEAQLIASWWRSMRDSALGSSDDDDGPNGTFNEMGTQAMSQAVAARGGLGLADIVVHYLQPKVEVNQCGTGQPTGVEQARLRQMLFKPKNQ